MMKSIYFFCAMAVWQFIFIAPLSAQPTVDIVVQSFPNAGGSVTINTATFSTYPSVTQVTNGGNVDISATPNTGYTFNSWHSVYHTLSPSNTANPASFTAQQMDTIYAYFDAIPPPPPDSFDVLINVMPHRYAGTVIVGGTPIASYPDTGRFEEAQDVDFEAVANAGWRFTHFVFNAHKPQPDSTMPVVFITIAQPDTVVAWFEKAPAEPDTLLHLLVPTAFSPNGDGINDIFRAVGEHIEDFSMVIYNRWGQKVFESNNQGYGWNGNYGNNSDNKKCDTGVYTYVLRGERQNGEDVKMSGAVTLIR